MVSDQSAHELREAARALADQAARAVCEPRRFHENRGCCQQDLSHAIASVRLVLNRLEPDEGER